VCTNGIANEDIDFTLVTQLSPIRLGIMKEQCKRWGHHPISLALASKIASKQAISRALLAMGCMRTTVTIVREFDDYPLNRLQNEALAAIETSHAVYVDADFLVSSSLYAELYEQKSQLHDPKVALVIPAFELRPLCDPGIPSCQELHKLTVPNTKMELLELYYVTNGPEATIAQFDSKKNLAGHASTRFIDWTTQESGALLPIECITSPRCEPYLAVRYCRDMPPFQEAFRVTEEKAHLDAAGAQIWIPSFPACRLFPRAFTTRQVSFLQDLGQDQEDAWTRVASC